MTTYPAPPLVIADGAYPWEDGDTITLVGQVWTRQRVSTNLKVSNIGIGSVAYGSLGTDGVHVAGTTYFSELFIPATVSCTKLAVLNGTTAGTDKLILALYDNTGAFVIGTDTAGTTASGTDAFQEISLTATTTLVGPARYFLALQCNGTTTKTRKIAASTYLNAASSATGTFGTLPTSITVPTSTTADKGPIGYALVSS
jgi:hypothetical protein